MKGSIILTLATILVVLFLTTVAWAETRYVTDQLVLTLRQGPSGNSKILKTLPTDTSLEVLGSSGEYLQVRTAEGEEGYVIERYLTTATPKAKIIAKLEEENQSLAQKLGKAEEILAKQEQVLKTRNEAEDTKAREKAALEAEVEALRQEKAEVLTAVGIKWFMAGAGVFFVGLLCGRASRPKRRGGLYS